MKQAQTILISEFELEALLANIREDIRARCEQVLRLAYDDILADIDAYFDHEIHERVLDAYQWRTGQSESATANHE